MHRALARTLLAITLATATTGCALTLRAAELTTLQPVTHPELREISGIARSARYPDVYWVHNDSGDTARLFAIRSDGSAVVPPYVMDRYRREAKDNNQPQWPGIAIEGASNIDWEDIALADGMLYIADTGNNGNARRDLGVYLVPEPNPAATERLRALRFVPIVYPDQDGFPGSEWRFDSEAMFIDGGQLFFLTKHRQAGAINGFARGTRLYRLDTQHTDRQNPLAPVGRHDEILLATAAALSSDGNTLAILSYTRVWLFPRPATGDNWLAGAAQVYDLPPLRTGIVEGITWDDAAVLLLVNEAGQHFRLPVAAFQPLAAH